MRVSPRTTWISSFTQLVTFSALRSVEVQPSPKFGGVARRCSIEHHNHAVAEGSAAATDPAGGNGVLAIPRHERKAARKSRSFRRRQAPITRGQRRKLREFWPKHGLVMDFNQRWDFSEIFSTTPDAAVTFDIGFGSGESLIEMATARPKEYFVGIEVHKPGVAAALARLEEEGLTNVKIAQGDAITALTDHIEDGSLSACCIFFPDPFPQDRDAGRRLVRPLLLSLLSSKLRAGGALHVATDVQAYAEHTVGVMETLETPENTLISSSSSSSWSPPPATEPVRGEGKEHRVESYDGGNFLRENHPTRETDDSGAPERSQRRQEQEEDKKIDHAGAGLASDVAFFPARWVGGEVQERPPWRPLTRYEEKAREAGRRVRDFSYRLESRTAPCQLTPVVSARE